MVEGSHQVIWGKTGNGRENAGTAWDNTGTGREKTDKGR